MERSNPSADGFKPLAAVRLPSPFERTRGMRDQKPPFSCKGDGGFFVGVQSSTLVENNLVTVNSLQCKSLLRARFLGSSRIVRFDRCSPNVIEYRLPR